MWLRMYFNSVAKLLLSSICIGLNLPDIVLPASAEPAPVYSNTMTGLGVGAHNKTKPAAKSSTKQPSSQHAKAPTKGK